VRLVLSQRCTKHAEEAPTGASNETSRWEASTSTPALTTIGRMIPMIASTKSSPARVACPSAVQHGPYLSIGRAASLLGCSVQSLRLWEAKGMIKAYRTCNGHGQRRYLLSELKSQVLGINGGGAPLEERKVAIYVRVSSQGQAREGSLDRQLQRMLVTVAAREGIPQDSIKVFKDVASAFGDRSAGLNPMVDELIEGKIEKIYVEHQDRLSRVPALTRLVEHLDPDQANSLH
jgi:predicted site-specific integrase-resolvase